MTHSLPRRRLGRTGLDVSVLGFGAAPVGDLYSLLNEDEALHAIHAALRSGVNFIDTSPHYGNGLSEHRIGTALRHWRGTRPLLSTKVGRVADPFTEPDASNGFRGGLSHRLAVDYSREGTLRSVEQSLLRLATDSIDFVLVHDLDRWTHGEHLESHYRTAMEGAVPALSAMRDEGVIRGYGLGVNEADMAERFARDCDPDVILLAGRYSLLEQPALESFLPFAQERDLGVILGGVFNSGILATGAVEGARYNYSPAPPEIHARVMRLEAVCQRHGVLLRRAALQFALGHPAVSSIVLGAETPAQVLAQVADLTGKIPAALWQDLKDESLLPPQSPAPASPSDE